MNRELWLELRVKKGQATQEDYKDAMRLYKEQSRRAKAQVELNLAIVVKDN